MIRWISILLYLCIIHNQIRAQSLLKENTTPSFKGNDVVSFHNTITSDSNKIEISLLTLTPGEDLYSVFGHTAIRVKDANVGTDIVYNYGTFDFEDPEFLPKFIRGELDYFISQETYEVFLQFYNSEGRGLNEQLLALNGKQKLSIQQYLFRNMEPENRLYRYNFLYNNCTTKIRDILHQFREKDMKTSDLKTTENMSFRDGLHYYLDRANHSWIKLGIDIILGSRIDKKMSNFESQFLPDFLEEGIDKATINGDPFVLSKNNILHKKTKPSTYFNFTPFVIFSLLLLMYTGLLYYPNRINSTLIQIIEVSTYFITGIISFLLIFLWAYTLHEQSKDNFNLLWAWPSQILAAFLYKKRNKYLKIYWLVLSISMLIIILSWTFLPQQLNPALIPILMILGISSYRNFKLN